LGASEDLTDAEMWRLNKEN